MKKKKKKKKKGEKKYVSMAHLLSRRYFFRPFAVQRLVKNYGSYGLFS